MNNTFTNLQFLECCSLARFQYSRFVAFLSIRLSICLLHAGIVPKRIKLRSRFLRHQIAPSS